MFYTQDFFSICTIIQRTKGHTFSILPFTKGSVIIMAETLDIYKHRIISILKQNSKKCIPYKALFAKCKGRKNSPLDFKQGILELKKDGTIFERKNGFVLCEDFGIFHAVVTRVNKTFGFIKKDDDTEVFIPGKFFKGAMPGDSVLAKLLLPQRGDSPEGEVIKILEENFSEFTGTIEKDGNTMCVRPDSLTKELLIISSMDIKAEVGDKVLAIISRRGERHSEHRVKVIGLFGSADKATSSAMAVLHLNGVETEFPLCVIDEAKHVAHKGLCTEETAKRLDLRDVPIFTIDGADTKDIDDAISIKKTEKGYELGVHIADVSYYVRPKSELDTDAFNRGTSIYYADKVIPMLPKELSNGICSLNPDEDRYAFSCLMEIDFDGQLKKYKFSKTVMRSRVKGVYSEINQILADRENCAPELKEKYGEVFDNIFVMEELAEILTANKLKRGAPQIETSESKLILDDDDVCIGVKERERGKSELIIEEFMLMANTSAAKLAKESGVPFVYRIHEDPAPEKVADLVEMVSRMGIAVPHFTSVKPSHLAEILRNTKDTKLALVVNNMVLRSMAKAKYSDEPIGHFGLVLADYSHFTSPIRRYPDLAIHRILTDLCYNKIPVKMLQKRYAGFAKDASMQSSQRELVAMRVERDCEDCYIAEYMSQHLGEEFDGVISSMQDYGFYVELPNTVEGLVRIDTVEGGPYSFDGHFTYTKGDKPAFSIGDSIKVKCAKADVSSGKIDFVLA